MSVGQSGHGLKGDYDIQVKEVKRLDRLSIRSWVQGGVSHYVRRLIG